MPGRAAAAAAACRTCLPAAGSSAARRRRSTSGRSPRFAASVRASSLGTPARRRTRRRLGRERSTRPEETSARHPRWPRDAAAVRCRAGTQIGVHRVVPQKRGDDVSWPRARRRRGCRISRPRRSRPRLGVGGRSEGTRQGDRARAAGRAAEMRSPSGWEKCARAPRAKRRACASGIERARVAPRPRPNRSRTFRQQGLHLPGFPPAHAAARLPRRSLRPSLGAADREATSGNEGKAGWCFPG